MRHFSKLSELDVIDIRRRLTWYRGDGVPLSTFLDDERARLAERGLVVAESTIRDVVKHTSFPDGYPCPFVFPRGAIASRW